MKKRFLIGIPACILCAVTGIVAVMHFKKGRRNYGCY